EIYGINVWPDTKDSTDGTAEIIIGKQRNGPTGSFRVVYLKDILRFDNGDFRYVDQEFVSTAVDDTYLENLEIGKDEYDVDDTLDSF
ncbi:MAG: hypothetical protein ACK4SO_07910, partial [Candidatus Kapaibacteriota bacterium]